MVTTKDLDTVSNDDINSVESPKIVTRERKMSAVKKLGNSDIVDPAKEIIESARRMKEAIKKLTGGKVVMKMERENATFLTDNGILFSREHPYQLVDEDESSLLIPQNFRVASPDEILEFYGKS